MRVPSVAPGYHVYCSGVQEVRVQEGENIAQVQKQFFFNFVFCVHSGKNEVIFSHISWLIINVMSRNSY